MSDFRIGNTLVGGTHPVYFIAEIGANHDGRSQRAKDLCYMARESGADAAKFQHYRADTLASKSGFDKIADLAHYGDNPHSVFRRHETPWDWTPKLKEYCDSIGIEFMSTPYDIAAVNHLDPYVNVWKIGSGDITYKRLIKQAVATEKPIILSTGASTLDDIGRAIGWIPHDAPLCILQCNTNYLDDDTEHIPYLNLRVIERLLGDYNVVMGISDHSRSIVPVLGAIALGAKVVEKHFTDGKSQSPDNPFALRPAEFRQMVEQVRFLEQALGDGVKRVEPNEEQTVVLQRRCLRAARDLRAGAMLTEADFVALRPAPVGSLPPYLMQTLVGKRLKVDMQKEEEFTNGSV